MDLSSHVAGKPAAPRGRLEVRSPFSGDVVGTVSLVGWAEAEAAVAAALAAGPPPSRHARHEVLERVRSLLEAKARDFARLITSESGLCLRDTEYEVGRALDVLRFAAIEALRDDGQIFSCDITAQGKPRKIFTLREPHTALLAITPFNHPLNQVLHKVAPAVAAGVPVILKPSEKTPLTAVRAAELFLEAGLPPERLSVLLGSVEEVVEPLVREPRLEVVSFTGSVDIGKRIAAIAGYKKLCLELGGNCPLIVCDDADLDLAVKLAAEGSFRNSGQRCTAINRILADERIAWDLARRLAEAAREYVTGDPSSHETRVGTVISEASAMRLESLVRHAVAAGAKLLAGGTRQGAAMAPTVLAEVPRDAEVVTREAFGPLAPIVCVRGLDDAIAVANATPYGLSSGVVTTSLEKATRAIKGLRAGTVNVNEVPGYRLESTPFGGIKDSGLGIKEGVIEAMRFCTWIKTFSLPWCSSP